MLRFIFAALLACFGSMALADTRVALVIGDGAYQSASRLDNPTRDADAVATALREAGFGTVQVERDLGHGAMLAALRRFEAEADGADWALVYFAGHSPDGRRLASRGYDRAVTLWDVETARGLHTFSGLSHNVKSLSFSPDAGRLAVGSEDKSIRLFDLASVSLSATIVSLPKRESVVLFPGGRFSSSAGASQYLSVVDGLDAQPLDDEFRQAFEQK